MKCERRLESSRLANLPRLRSDYFPPKKPGGIVKQTLARQTLPLPVPGLVEVGGGCLVTGGFVPPILPLLLVPLPANDGIAATRNRVTTRIDVSFFIFFLLLNCC